MDDCVNSIDLESYFLTLQTLIDKYRDNSESHNELVQLVEVLRCENEMARESERLIREEFRNMCKVSESQNNISELFAELKESYNNLKQENSKLKEDYIQLEKRLLVERSAMLQEIGAKEKELTKEFLKTTHVLQNENAKQKRNYEQKIQDLTNELQSSHATSALEFDEMESRLNSLLSDTSQKLKESKSRCNTLQSEIFILKDRLNSNIKTSDKKYLELERQFRNAEEQLQSRFKYRESSEATKCESNVNCSVVQKYAVPNRNNCEISRQKFGISDNIERNANKRGFPVGYERAKVSREVNFDKQPISSNVAGNTNYAFDLPSGIPDYTKTARNTGIKKITSNLIPPNNANVDESLRYNLHKDPLPVLKQVSNAVPTRSSFKKRKLYNPNDLDYLSNLGCTE